MCWLIWLVAFCSPSILLVAFWHACVHVCMCACICACVSMCVHVSLLSSGISIILILWSLEEFPVFHFLWKFQNIRYYVIEFSYEAISPGHFFDGKFLLFIQYLYSLLICSDFLFIQNSVLVQFCNLFISFSYSYCCLTLIKSISWYKTHEFFHMS